MAKSKIVSVRGRKFWRAAKEFEQKPHWLSIGWSTSSYGCRVRNMYGAVTMCCFPFEEI